MPEFTKNPSSKYSFGINPFHSARLKTFAEKSFLSRLSIILLIAAAYYAAARIGLLVAIPPGIATPVWAPSGIALAAVLLLGYRVFPGIILGSFLVNFQLSPAPPGSLVSFSLPFAISLGSALQAVLGAFLLQRFFKMKWLLGCVQDIFKFFFIELAVCLLSPTIGAASLLLSGLVNPEDLHYLWWTWWTGDFIGILAVTPLLISWGQFYKRSSDINIVLKISGYFLALFIVTVCVFGGNSITNQVGNYLHPYVLVPFVIWAALWFGNRGVTLATMFISVMATWGTNQGYGPFASGIRNDAFLMLQPFIGVLSMTGLIFSAALAENKQAHEDLKGNQKELYDFVENAPVGLHWVGPNGIIIWANKTELNMLGYTREEYVGHPISKFYAEPLVVENIMTRLQNHEELQNQEVELRCKDGSFRSVLISSNVLWDNGTFVHTRCFTRDITDRKRAETNLMKAHVELEKRVLERTQELSQAYGALEVEMSWRLQAQKDILEISECEQKRIGQDLHDGLAQQLAGLSFMCKTLQYKLSAKEVPEAEAIEDILGILKKTIEDTRRLSRGFYPVELEKLGLLPALKELAMDVEKIYQIPCFYELDDRIDIPDDVTAAHVYRITQEALSNAAKHGKAGQVNLSMKRQDGQVVLSIEDDGVGINKENLNEKMGLRIMNYRAKMIGADFQIENKEEGGAKVTFSFQS